MKKYEYTNNYELPTKSQVSRSKSPAPSQQGHPQATGKAAAFQIKEATRSALAVRTCLRILLSRPSQAKKGNLSLMNQERSQPRTMTGIVTSETKL